MRIGISARSLAYTSGGPTEYLIGLLDALFALDRKNEYVLFYPNKTFFGRYPKGEEVSLDADNRLVFDWLKLPAALKKHRIDLAFFPSSNMPPRIPCKAVVAMLDLGYFHEEFRMYRLAETLYMRPMIRYSARRAERLTAISDYTRQDAIRRLNVNPEKITAIPLAADPIYNVGAPDEAVTNFREQRGLARNFFLYAGNISPRKNLKTLLAAFAMAKDGLDADLVITGGRAWDEDFDRLLRENGLTKRVIRLGHIEKKDMPLLYRSSLALVFPSLFEGFGLPVLEAQACGTPVICANATSLPEAAGDGALLIDPKSPESIRNALLSLAKDPELRSRLIEKGRVNEARFSWKSTARRTLAVFESLN